MTPRDLVGASGRELASVLERGHRFDPVELDGWSFRGISLGLPRWVERLTWSKFAKAFQRDETSGRLRGWNVRIVQDGLDRPWRPMLKGGEPVRFGFFEVVDGATGVILDYSAGGGLARSVRDPLVSLRAGSADLLLGRSLLDLGLFSLPTPSYFVLERGERLT